MASQKKSCEWPKYSWRACEGSISLGIFHKNDAILRTWKNSKGPPSSHVSSDVWKEYTFIAKVKEMQYPIQWWSCVVVLCFVNILRNTMRAVYYTSHCPLSPLKNHPELWIPAGPWEDSTEQPEDVSINRGWAVFIHWVCMF